MHVTKICHLIFPLPFVKLTRTFVGTRYLSDDALLPERCPGTHLLEIMLGGRGKKANGKFCTLPKFAI